MMIKQECVIIKYTHIFCMKEERRKEFHHFQIKFLFHKPTSLNCVILFKSCRQIFESSGIFDNQNLIKLDNLTCCREGAFQATQRFSHDLQRGELTRRRFKKVLQEVLKKRQSPGLILGAEDLFQETSDSQAGRSSPPMDVQLFMFLGK